MSNTARRLMIAAGLAGGLLLAVAPAAHAVTGPLPPISPIEPNQAFIGLVNGSTGAASSGTNAGVPFLTNCPLPVSGGASGTAHPQSGQTIEVMLGSTVADAGFTGSAGTSITADLLYQLSPTGPTYVEELGTFTDYGVLDLIPTSINVPCTGTGEVAFIPSPDSSTARTATVPVVFDPSGVQPGSAAR
jgi:hypothetical protein